MSDIITLEPRQAGETLAQMQHNLKAFLEEINHVAEILRAVSALTFSTPLTAMFQIVANILTNIGNAVNAAVDAYSQAFVRVIEQWKQTDATAAGDVSFDKPGFDGVTIVINDAVKVEVHPGKVRNLMSQHEHHASRMHTHFGTMDTHLNQSSGYWIGQSGDQTRHAWQKNVMPLQEQCQKVLQQALELIGSELEGFLSRDAANFVN